MMAAGVSAKNPECERHFERYVSDLAQRKIWAVSSAFCVEKLLEKRVLIVTL